MNFTLGKNTMQLSTNHRRIILLLILLFGGCQGIAYAATIQGNITGDTSQIHGVKPVWLRKTVRTIKLRPETFDHLEQTSNIVVRKAIVSYPTKNLWKHLPQLSTMYSYNRIFV